MCRKWLLITLPLPSRAEKCQFVLNPQSQTVGEFCSFVRKEDPSVTFVALRSEDGVRLAQSSPLDRLIFSQFNIQLNDTIYSVGVCLPDDSTSSEIIPSGHSLKQQSKSSENADVNKFVKDGVSLMARLNNVLNELQPMEDEIVRLKAMSERRTSRLMWLGLVFMGVQGGLFARLTWWEYSWDVMEPVTYFATYSVAVVSYAYFLITKQQYEYPVAKERTFVRSFYKYAEVKGFDVDKYNSLKAKAAQLQRELQLLGMQALTNERNKAKLSSQPLSSSA